MVNPSFMELFPDTSTVSRLGWNVPGELYTWEVVGPLVTFAGDEPSPKSQLYCVITFPAVALLRVALKLTVRGAFPLVGVAPKFAVGVKSVKSPSCTVSLSVVPNASVILTHTFGGLVTLLVEQPEFLG